MSAAEDGGPRPPGTRSSDAHTKQPSRCRGGNHGASHALAKLYAPRVPMQWESPTRSLDPNGP
eukprot:7663319-Prorocentrum_lima.AAC.1